MGLSYRDSRGPAAPQAQLFPLLNIEIGLLGNGLQRNASRNGRLGPLFLGALCGLLHFGVEIYLRTKPERDRVLRLQVGGIPVGALAYGLNVFVVPTRRMIWVSRSSP